MSTSIGRNSESSQVPWEDNDCPCIDPDHCEVAGGCLIEDLGLDEEDE